MSIKKYKKIMLNNFSVKHNRPQNAIRVRCHPEQTTNEL